MGKDSQSELVGVRVTPSRKEELEEYAEENGYDSVPSLFRRAVAHELSDDYGLLVNQQSGGSPDQLGEVVTTVSKLRTQIEELSEEVSMLSEEMRSDRAPRVLQRMSAIHRELPTDESQAMDFKQVAEQFEDMSHQTAWEALMHLYDETGSVHRSTEGGWYKDARSTTSDHILTPSEEPDDVTRFHSWIEGHKDYSASTARKYRQGARRWAAWVEYDSVDDLERDPEELDFSSDLKDGLFTPNDVDLLEPDPRDVEDFFMDLRTYLAPKTMSTTRAGLNTFLRFRGPWADPQPGGSSSYPDQTPADKARIGTWNAESVKSEEQRQSKHFLESDQVEKLLANVPEPTLRNKLLLRLMLQTGVRASEVATIRCGRNPDWGTNGLRDIDRENRTIRVRDRKSSGYRTVVYQSSLESLLRLWIETERAGVYGADASPYLFVTKNGDHINRQYVNTGIVKPAAENAGIQRIYTVTANGQERAEVTSQVLRHTFAMHALRNELDTHWIKEQLGHDDSSTTIDMYLHEDEETMIKEVSKRGPNF